jgi:guanylate kinase
MSAGDMSPGRGPATEIRRRGFLLVLSSPSGAGKTTITRRLLERDATLSLSVSVTTRPRRSNEIDGRDYYFVDQATFNRMVADGELLEHAVVFGHCYGTPRGPIEALLAAGSDIVTDIDWQGTQQLSATIGDDLVTVFVLPPSKEVLEQRLRSRAQDSDEAIVERMAKSSEEMSHWPEYNYVVVNDILEECVTAVETVVTAERLKRVRRVGLADFINQMRAELERKSV